jgi:hypothetical protein
MPLYTNAECSQSVEDMASNGFNRTSGLVFDKTSVKATGAGNFFKRAKNVEFRGANLDFTVGEFKPNDEAKGANNTKMQSPPPQPVAAPEATQGQSASKSLLAKLFGYSTGA